MHSRILQNFNVLQLAKGSRVEFLALTELVLQTIMCSSTQSPPPPPPQPLYIQAPLPSSTPTQSSIVHSHVFKDTNTPPPPATHIQSSTVHSHVFKDTDIHTPHQPHIYSLILYIVMCLKTQTPPPPPSTLTHSQSNIVHRHVFLNMQAPTCHAIHTCTISYCTHSCVQTNTHPYTQPPASTQCTAVQSCVMLRTHSI